MASTEDSDLLQESLRYGFVDAEQSHATQFAPTLIANSDGNTMLRALRSELRLAQTFTFSVAFVTPGAIAALKQELIDFSGSGRVITSDYLLFNSPRAFRELLSLRNVETYIYQANRKEGPARPFHAKGYLFRQGEITTGIVGSSNLTQAALSTNVEWNLRVSALRFGGITAMLDNEISAQLANSVLLTPEWVDEYVQHYVPLRSSLSEMGKGNLPEEILIETKAGDSRPDLSDETSAVTQLQPNSMQQRALTAIHNLRMAGESRAIVVSATGTGKTLLSAFDVQRMNPKRFLFVVHREQILRRAIAEYQRVLPGNAEDFGLFTGSERNKQSRYVFATVQSLTSGDSLQQFNSDDFEYIVIDEVHRSASAGYKRILEYFTPLFLLGMTATPERTDGADIFEAFDYNTAYEIRLNEALETGVLCPFHYYGVSEYLTEDSESKNDVGELVKLADPERVDYVLRQIELHAQAGVMPKGIIFCSRNREAEALAREFNSRKLFGRPLRTAAVSGQDSQIERGSLVAKLRSGKLDYLLSVDIFNEGIDIPEVNQIVMLRQTKSSIVFVQQLGRGLRKSPGKEYLVVIDFIGNYQNNYMIPTALFGDRSRNRDNLRHHMRRALSEGTLSGLSTVSFDRIAIKRVMESINTARIAGKQELIKAYRQVRARMSMPPRLQDFVYNGGVDPVVLATGFVNYARLLTKAGEEVPVLSQWQDAVLTFITQELLNGRRRAELDALRRVLSHDGAEVALKALLEPIAESVQRVLNLQFYTQAERTKFGGVPLVLSGQSSSENTISIQATPELADSYAHSDYFARMLDDTIETGLMLNKREYGSGDGLVIGKKYGRKDALRVLNWQNNQSSTVYGYKVDLETGTCPIFVTYNKSEEIAETTRYADKFIDPHTFSWFTRSRRNLESKEVRQILDGDIALHLFVKQSDSEGTDFYYLGQVRAGDAEQLTMSSKSGEVPVVRITLELEHGVEGGLYDFLTMNQLDA